MEADGQDVRAEPLEERRKRLAKLLQQGTARRHPIERGNHRRWSRHLSSCVLDGPRRDRLEAHRLSVRQRQNAGVVEDEEPEFRAQPIAEPWNLQCGKSSTPPDCSCRGRTNGRRLIVHGPTRQRCQDRDELPADFPRVLPINH